MTIYAKEVLTGSTNGKPIAVAATAIGSGTTIHTVPTLTSTQYDEVYIWACNTDSVEHYLTLGLGGSATANLMPNQVVLPANSPPMPVLCGVTLGSGVVVTAASDAANMVNLTGHVNTAR